MAAISVHLVITLQWRRDHSTSLSSTAQLFDFISNLFITFAASLFARRSQGKVRIRALSHFVFLVHQQHHCQRDSSTGWGKVGHDEPSEVLTALWNEQLLWLEYWSLLLPSENPPLKPHNAHNFSTWLLETQTARLYMLESASLNTAP